MSEINSAFKTLHIQRAGKQKFKKRHVISRTIHMEKMANCTCIYVSNASSKGSGETAQICRLVGAFVARIGNKNHCQLRVYVFEKYMYMNTHLAIQHC